VVGNETWLEDAWQFNDRSGTSGANSVSARPAATILGGAGATWAAGRHCAADLSRHAYLSAGFTVADLETSSWLAAVQDQPALCQHLVKDGASHLAVIDFILGGLRYSHFPTRAGLVRVKRFTAPSSSGLAAEYVGEIALRDEALEPEEGRPPIYRVFVGYCRNNTPLDASSVAAIIASNPVQFAYATKEWRYAQKQDLSVRQNADGSDGAYPEAEALTIETALISRADAETEAAAWLALFKVAEDPLRIPLFSQPLSLNLHDRISITEADGRLGLDPGYFVVIGLEEEDDEVTIVGWRQAA
jgi:hypothetical protein